MHASLDMFWMLSMPVAITGKERVIWYALWAVVLWSMVAIISITSNRKYSDKEMKTRRDGKYSSRDSTNA